jgi:hypothetical protein
MAFFYASDEMPPVDIEQMFLNVFKQEQWIHPTLASAAGK